MSVAPAQNLVALPGRFADLQRELEITRERCRQLETALGARTLFAPQLGLTRSEAAVLGVLLAREIGSNEALILAIGSEGPVWAVASLRVLISRLRGKLRPHGVLIHSLHGTGYYLAEADKRALRPLVQPTVNAETFHGKQA